LRRALAVGSEGRSEEGFWSLRRLHRLFTRKQADQARRSQQMLLASLENKAGYCLPVSTGAPSPGEVIGGYEILERIGGNMGLVFKARHQMLDKVVVLKLVPADCIADPARLTRFQREMRAMGQLEHPNLVTAADARSVGEWHFVAMEFIDGVDLHQLVRVRGGLPIAAACEAARQAAQGLQYAHEHGLIHRDIKPSNLMLTRAGVLKVIDMGLALIREDSTAQLTQTGLVLGTMSYCAPEQFRDASHVDIRADIYSLGCTLFHLLTGKSPYWERKTFAEVMQAHLHDPFPSLAEALPNAPAGLEAVLARMTAKDREARFSTPREVVEALEPFARGANLGPLVPAKSDQSPAGQVTPGRTPGPPPKPRTEEGAGQRPKLPWPSIAALLVLLAIVGIVILAVVPTKKDARTIVPDRVVVLMDTTAPKGIYDADNIDAGRSNADELYTRLAGLDGILSPSSLHKELIGIDWARDSFVISLDPDLVIIHRSSFFHPLAARIKLAYPPFANAEDEKRFKDIYDAQDLRLRGFISLVGSALPHSHFLVYSRGTDTNWLNPVFRTNWTATLASEFTNLQGRIQTMVIPNESRGTFRDPATMEELRGYVREMLKFPKKQKPEKTN
jgi:serine/threonine protein kinase